MTYGSCGGLWPPCLAEIHSVEVGIFIGGIGYATYLKSSIGFALLMSVVLVLSIMQPIDGVTKPWYTLFGVVVGMVVGRVVHIAARKEVG